MLRAGCLLERGLGEARLCLTTLENILNEEESEKVTLKKATWGGWDSELNFREDIGRIQLETLRPSFVSDPSDWDYPSRCCCYCCWAAKLCPTLSPPQWLQPIRLLCPWDSPGKNTKVGCHFLLQGLFLTRDWTHIFCSLFTTEHQGSPYVPGRWPKHFTSPEVITQAWVYMSKQYPGWTLSTQGLRQPWPSAPSPKFSPLAPLHLKHLLLPFEEYLQDLLKVKSWKRGEGKLKQHHLNLVGFSNRWLISKKKTRANFQRQHCANT